MTVDEAVANCIDYHRINSKENTSKNLKFIFQQFLDHFHRQTLSSISSEDVLAFLNGVTEGAKNSTKTLRFSQLNAFFNFHRLAIDPDLINPCDTPFLKKAFKRQQLEPWTIFGERPCGRDDLQN